MALRPHVKTHKAPEIARMQLDAGARGITVAKLGEAEVMADAGLDDILIAYPIVGEPSSSGSRRSWIRAEVRVSLDTIDVAEGLGRVGVRRGVDVPVLVEVDTGSTAWDGRRGSPRRRWRSRSRVFPGSTWSVCSPTRAIPTVADATELRSIAEREALDLLETAERCARMGLEMREISVGSTPTARIVAGVPGVTEVRPGTYVYNDVQQLRLGVATVEACAARVLVTVVARPTPERFLIDGGTKSFSADGGDGPPFRDAVS